MCCIYHKTRAVGESSSEDDSDSSSSDGDGDSGTEPDNSKARMGGKGRKRDHKHKHDHDGGDEGQRPDQGDSHRKTGRRRRASPNAYERMPKTSENRAKKS